MTTSPPSNTQDSQNLSFTDREKEGETIGAGHESTEGLVHANTTASRADGASEPLKGNIPPKAPDESNEPPVQAGDTASEDVEEDLADDEEPRPPGYNSRGPMSPASSGRPRPTVVEKPQTVKNTR
ncbi:hypothetical protein PQX77_011969 [Marasmius sp. AFHP31]|nr:hypothetical protein PQX77_011969 [Marasmius sp. AFHP31]